MQARNAESDGVNVSGLSLCLIEGRGVEGEFKSDGEELRFPPIFEMKPSSYTSVLLKHSQSI